MKIIQKRIIFKLGKNTISISETKCNKNANDEKNVCSTKSNGTAQKGKQISLVKIARQKGSEQIYFIIFHFIIEQKNLVGTRRGC